MIPRIHIYALIFVMCMNKTMCTGESTLSPQVCKQQSRWGEEQLHLSPKHRKQIQHIHSELEKEKFTVNDGSAPFSFNVKKGENKVECQVTRVGFTSPEPYVLKITYYNNQNQGFGNNENTTPSKCPINKALPHIKHWLENGTKLNENRDSVSPLNTEENPSEHSTELLEPTSCVDRMRQSLHKIRTQWSARISRGLSCLHHRLPRTQRNVALRDNIPLS